jgi:hypothetical protein
MEALVLAISWMLSLGRKLWEERVRRCKARSHLDELKGKEAQVEWRRKMREIDRRNQFLDHIRRTIPVVGPLRPRDSLLTNDTFDICSTSICGLLEQAFHMKGCAVKNVRYDDAIDPMYENSWLYADVVYGVPTPLCIEEMD